MKLILLAAAAVIATPALAQTSGSTGTSSPTSNGGAGTPTDTRNSANDTMQTTPSQTPSGSMPDQTMTPSQSGTMSGQPMTGQSGTMSDQTVQTQSMPAQTTGGADPVGGYQPTAPAMSGAMQPGATVTFQPAPSPDQAYPAPAPMASYPVCKPGQYDDCIQRGEARSSSRARRRR